MAGGNRGRSAVKDVRRHNLSVLNPDRRRPTLAPSLTVLERDRGLRFILQTARPTTPERLAAAAWNGRGLVTDVKPLFPTTDAAADTNGMDRYFVVTVPGLAQRDVAIDPFDLGYELAARLGEELVSFEPDLPHAVFHGTPETSIARGFNPCSVDSFIPDDRAWHLRSMRVPLAWGLTPPAGGNRFGRGSVIGHIDTGWGAHDDFAVANVHLDRGWDFIDDDADPHDPLESGSFLGGPSSPGHGVATSSVIVGRGNGAGVLPDPARLELWGVAPNATLVPIRAIRFVFFLFDSDVAQAITFAANQGCHVLSMSLGGVPTSALEAAVNYAVAKDVIVCSAAGNCLPSVSVGPAVYPNCIAVAGCNIEDQPWRFSSHGAKVAVTAPAENVWAARRSPGDPTTAHRAASQGTSFAVAGVAGVAALWLAFHGRDRLRQKYGGQAFLHHVFLHLLRETSRASSHLPAGDFGSGIVDAHALLAAPLPEPGAVAGPGTVANLTVLSQPEVIAALYDADPGAVRAQLASLLGDDAQAAGARGSGVDNRANLWAPELIHILTQDAAAHRQFGDSLAMNSAARASPHAIATNGKDYPLAHDIGRLASRGLRRATVPTDD